MTFALPPLEAGAKVAIDVATSLADLPAICGPLRGSVADDAELVIVACPAKTGVTVATAVARLLGVVDA